MQWISASGAHLSPIAAEWQRDTCRSPIRVQLGIWASWDLLQCNWTFAPQLCVRNFLNIFNPEENGHTSVHNGYLCSKCFPLQLHSQESYSSLSAPQKTQLCTMFEHFMVMVLVVNHNRNQHGKLVHLYAIKLVHRGAFQLVSAHAQGQRQRQEATEGLAQQYHLAPLVVHICKHQKTKRERERESERYTFFLTYLCTLYIYINMNCKLHIVYIYICAVINCSN